jgi:hypothetical protein
MEKGAIKLVVFIGEYFSYWKNQTRNYLSSQGRASWEIVQTRHVMLAMLENAAQGVLQRYENNYKALNLIITDLRRNVYDRVSHLETTQDIWIKLCKTYEGSSKIKSSNVVGLLKFGLSLLEKSLKELVQIQWLPHPFIAQDRAVTGRPGAQHVAPR